MKYFIIITIILILTSTFLYGIGVGHFEVFPYNELKYVKSFFPNDSQNHQTNYLSYDTNVNSIIDIYTIDDINDKRQKLLNLIWKNDSPNLDNLVIKNNIFDDRYEHLSNLQSIHKYEIKMENNVNSIAYHFIPIDMNSNLIIYHQGHLGDFIEGVDTIQFFLNNGYSVLAFTMPLFGMNTNPIIQTDDFGNFKLTSHNQLYFLESEQFSPIKYFVEPIWISLDYIDQNFTYDSYNMLGISGGGWTTTLYSAIDDRILESYSVAGSLPIFLRSDPKNFGDYEQINNDLYKITNYLELYLLASSGDNRKFIQIFNENDPCCFSGDPRGYYDELIQNRLSQFSNGTFSIFIDTTHNKHIISDYSRTLILELLNS